MCLCHWSLTELIIPTTQRNEFGTFSLTRTQSSVFVNQQKEGQIVTNMFLFYLTDKAKRQSWLTSLVSNVFFLAFQNIFDILWQYIEDALGGVSLLTCFPPLQTLISCTNICSFWMTSTRILLFFSPILSTISTFVFLIISSNLLCFPYTLSCTTLPILLTFSFHNSSLLSFLYSHLSHRFIFAFPPTISVWLWVNLFLRLSLLLPYSSIFFSAGLSIHYLFFNEQ